jgi:hypothetical protein
VLELSLYVRALYDLIIILHAMPLRAGNSLKKEKIKIS